MKRLDFYILLLVMSITNAQIPKNGVENPDDGINIADFVTMSGNWFIAYRDGRVQIQADEDQPLIETQQSEFVLKRSYFTLKKDLNETFSVRYTQDLTIDREGNDAGNVETRLKYLYLKMKPDFKSEVFTGNWVEVGMVHTPWLDYEQKINTFRVQDNMFIERNRIFNSADFGITIGGNIGPKMDEDFLNNVDNSMQGKYISYAIGLYNGGGYSSEEVNNNKVISGRITTRPFANRLPQIQLSAYYNTGKGNITQNPDFNQFLGFVAYSGKDLTLTAQYHDGEGDFRGRYVYEDNLEKAIKNNGYSFFGEYRLPNTPWSAFARYDYFDLDQPNAEIERYIGGITYRVSDFLRLVLDTEHLKSYNEKDNIYELNFEITF